MKMKKKYQWLALFMAFVMTFGSLPGTAFAKSHIHDEDCYAKEGELLCEISESDGHTHSDDCVCPGGEYICGFTTTKEHTHDDDCYDYIGDEESDEKSDDESDDEEFDEEESTPSNAVKKTSKKTLKKILVCTLKEQKSHEHTSECVCPGGEIICDQEEGKGHTHGEDCYAKGGELICGKKEIEDNNFLLTSMEEQEEIMEEQDEIMDAQDLKDACEKADDGATLKLGEDITYDQGELGTININKKITIDCNNHKISVDDALFEIESKGNLTLVNAEIETISDDFIDEIKAGGVLNIESTAGDGIVTNDDFIVYNYGTVNIKKGVFRIGYSLVYECYEYAKVVIEDADVEADEYIVGYIEDAGCSLQIKDGDYTAGSNIVYSTYGNITIEGGTFTSADNTFHIYGDAVINISGGTFTSDTNVINAYDDVTFNLSGGTFTNTSGDNAFKLNDNAAINIVEGFLADHADWSETDASTVRVYPTEFDVVFSDADGNELYRETVKSGNTVKNWPAQPSSPSEDYRWWGWVDSDGMRYDSKYKFTLGKELYAKFVNEGLPVEPIEPDEPVVPIEPDEPVVPETPEMPEMPSGEETVVTSYEELKYAIDAKADNIRISGDINFPEKNGTLKIVSNVYITADKDTHIYGHDYGAFSVFNGITVTVDGLNIDIGSGSIFDLRYGSVCNIVAGNYSAADDLIVGLGTVNLYGGHLEEKTGNDGPLYEVKVVYKNHTKDGDDSVSIIEVVPAEIFTVTLYDGEEILKTVQIYEDETLSLPDIKTAGFLGWFDADGTQYYSGYVNSNLTLYAAYEKSIVIVRFKVDGAEHKSEISSGTMLSEADGFSLASAWQDGNGLVWDASSIVERDVVLYSVNSDGIIKTLDEFKAAVAGTSKSFVIGAEIPVTETLVVDRSLSISAVDGGALVRADGFTDTLLKIESQNDSVSNVTIGNLLIDGRKIEAGAPAISVGNAGKLILRGTTICNNYNLNKYYYNDPDGGAVYSNGKVYIYDGTTLCSNKAYNGGGIEIDCERDKTTACLYLYGGDICHNSAWSNSSCEGAGGGVHIADDKSEDYVAFYMYGGRIHHNRAEEADSTDKDYHGGGVSLTCGDDGIHFVMYDGEITDNYAAGKGGAVYTGCSSMAMYGGVMARNVAEKNGGAVATDCCDNTLYMYGGTITLNVAGVSGGGVDSTKGAPYTLLGNVYGNFAAENGDDVFANNYNYGAKLRKVNDSISSENPYYIADEMQELYKTLTASRPDYKIINPIAGYDFAKSKPTNISHIGWFEDKEDRRYVVGDKAIATTNAVDKTSFELEEEQDVKAVYGGLLLVYDANYGSGEYQYDPYTYNNGTNAATQENMFERDSYKFIGWNSESDGSGAWYYPDFNGYNKIFMDSNKVVYAQWIKIPKAGNLTVSKIVTGNAGETKKEFSFTLKLEDSTLNGNFGDMIFEDGTANFTLKHNEQKSAIGLPAGTRYEVTETEANQDGYTTTVSGETGSIEKDKTVTAAFTNTKNKSEDELHDDLGNLIVSKFVAGNAGDTEKEFSFTVKLGDSSVSGNYGDMIFEDGTASFTLKHGKKMSAIGLPAGISYEVSETEANQDGYTTTVTGENGSIEKDKTATAAFTNTKNSGGGDNPGGNDDNPGGNNGGNDGGNNGHGGGGTSNHGHGTSTVNKTVSETNGDTAQPTPENPDVPASQNIPDMLNTSDNPNVPETSSVPTDQVPKTGDESNDKFWLFVMIISFVSFAGVCIFERKRRYTEHHAEKKN